MSIPQVRDKVASLNIDRELLASWAFHENLHFLVVSTYVVVKLINNKHNAFSRPTGSHVTSHHHYISLLTETQFLDLDIWVTLATNRMPSCTFISLFDKRLAFGFHVIKFPNTYSNTYTPQAQTTFYTEIVRLYRINTHSHLFLQNTMDLATVCILSTP